MDDWHIDALYERHARGVFAFLAFRSGDRALAEDLLADTFERVLRARRRLLRRPRDEKAWLYRIALNVLRDHARRSSAEERALTAVAAGESDPPQEFDRFEAHDAVRRAIATLSVEEQQAVALRFGADLTVPEIAAILEEPLSRVEGRVYRALRKLRPVLDDER